MVSFAQPLFWHIRYLVSNLSKKNYKSSVAELHHLVGLYGYDAQVFFLRTLIEEVQFQDAKHSSGGSGGGRDQLKTQLLQNELKDIECEEHFGTVLCQAAESFRDSVLTEEYAAHICKVARLQLAGQLSLGVACLQSTSDVTRREGAKFLRARIRTYAAPGSKSPRLPETLLHRLLVALRGSELEEVLEERDREALFRQLVDLHPGAEMVHGRCAGLLQLQRMSLSRAARHDKPAAVADVPLLAGSTSDVGLFEGVRACDILEEIGRGIISDQFAAARDVLSLFPGIGAQGIAEIVCMVVRTAGEVVDPNAGLAAGALEAAVSGSWDHVCAAPCSQDMAVSSGDVVQEAVGVIAAVRVALPDAPWAEVFELIFDLPDLYLPSESACRTLIASHAAACSEERPFPLPSVLRLRRNATAQLQFLRFAAVADQTLLDFAAPRPSLLIPPVPGLPGAEDAESARGSSRCWACVAFVGVLLELAEVEDYGEVLSLFEVPLAGAPEALLLVLSIVEDRSRGVMRTELLSRLAPLLLEEGRPSLALVQALAERASAQLTQLLRAMAEKDLERGLPRVLDILQKQELSSLYNSLLAESPTDLSCQLSILAASHGTHDIGGWLRSVLQKHKDSAAIGLVRFLQARLIAKSEMGEGVATKGEGSESQQGGGQQPPSPQMADRSSRSPIQASRWKQPRAPGATEVSRSPEHRGSRAADLRLDENERQAAALQDGARGTDAPTKSVPAGRIASLPSSRGAEATSGGAIQVATGACAQLPSWADEKTLCEAFLDALNEALPSLSPDACRQVHELTTLAQQRNPGLMPTPAPPDTTPLVGVAQVTSEAPPAPPPSAPPPPPQSMSPEDLEESSNSYFSKIYTGEMTVPQLIEIMKDFASHERGDWKHEVYSRMISNLFDECRFFPKYPPQELTITGELFGLLIKHDLVHASNLGLALRCVLEALRRPSHTKMFRFGILALEQFLERLPVWPALCQHLTQIQDLSEAFPSYVQYARDILKALPEELRQQTPGTQLSALKQDALQNYQMPTPPPKLSAASGQVPPPSVPPPGPAAGEVSAVWEPPGGAPPPQPPPAAPPLPAGSARTPPPAGSPPTGPPSSTAPEAVPIVPPPSSAGAGAPSAMGGSLMFGATATVDSLLNDPELQIDKPANWIQDTVAAIFNSLVKDNLESKAEEMRNTIQPEHHVWLSYYLVKNRAAKEVNFHPTYIEFFEKLKQPRLMDTVTNVTYECLRVLLKSVDQAVVSTSHRTVLKNLGYWLGQITLGRNKPLKGKHVDLKALLLEAYENGRLTAVLPLVCKVLEGVQMSRVYKLPNPWTAAIMSLLAEIHDVPNLRTNLMFEVEVLCKHLDIKISDLKRSELLSSKRVPSNSNDLSGAARHTGLEAKHHDLGSKDAGATTVSTLRGDAAAWSGGAAVGHNVDAGKEDLQRAQASAYVGAGGEALLLGGLSGVSGTTTAPAVTMHAASVAPGQDDFIIPTLPSLVTVSQSIQLFQAHPQLRGMVPLAVDRAIKEVISAVVERSVNISCWTTREMVTKDFAMEPDENVLKKAAELMVSSLASSLALVTCREPLRVSLTNHLWALLQNCLSKEMSEYALDQVVHVLATDNLELGCNLIEQAVVDKARKDIDESIAPAIQARQERKAQSQSTPYFDASYWHGNSKWPQALPEILQPQPGPVPSAKLKVYTDFNSMPPGKARLGSGHPLASVAGADRAGATAVLGVAPTAPPHEPPLFLPVQGIAHPTEATSLPEAALPQEVQALLSSILLSAEEAVKSLLADLPLLPPIDPINPAAYKQDAALDACAALAALPLEHELLQLLRQVPQWISQSTHPEALAMEAARRLFRQLYEAQQGLPHLHPPDTISPLHAVLETHLALLDALRAPLEDRLSKTLAAWAHEVQGSPRFDIHIVAGLLRYQLVVAADMDRTLAKWVGREPGTHGVMNAQGVDFVVSLLQRVCLFQRSAAGGAFPQTVEVLEFQAQAALQQQAVAEQQAKAIADAQAAALARGLKAPQVQQDAQMWPSPQDLPLAEATLKLLEELRSTEAAERRATRQLLNSRVAERVEQERQRRSAGHSEVEAISREQITLIFEEWHKVFDASPDSLQGHGGPMGCTQVLQRICSTFARSDERLEQLFRVCCSYAVERSFADSALSEPATEDVDESQEGGGESQSPMNFAVIDSFTRLVYWMMKHLDKVQLLTRVLAAITKELRQDANEKGSSFNQRPYFRILLNLLMEVNAPDPKFEQVNFQLLCAFSNTFLQVNPLRLPNFAFAWLELISNRMFMPKLLNRKGAPVSRLMFQRLLVQLLYGLEPYLRRVKLTESTRLLYKGTMRMLLVLLHDFPEFLCDYHFSFCNIVPIPCVQIRNLILSAFPRDMRLPDPFEPNLKVDKLPEINVPPKILSDYQSALLHQGLKADVDAYMRTPDKRLLETIKEKLRLPKSEREALQLETQYNVPLLNALLLYVGVSLPSKRLPGQGGLQNNPVEIFMYLVQQLDYEGRYLFLSAIANHLRYPNTHTHLFSCIILYLFDGTSDEVVREQITRVLLERLIVHRPHPWGLLITFIELIRNRRYEFWSHSFVTIAPEIEKLFHSVALTWNCGPSTAAM